MTLLTPIAVLVKHPDYAMKCESVCQVWDLCDSLWTICRALALDLENKQKFVAFEQSSCERGTIPKGVLHNEI